MGSARPYSSHVRISRGNPWKGYFRIHGNAPHSPNEIDVEFQKWLPTLERALIDPLGGLITSYAKAIRAHNCAQAFPNLDDLLSALNKASAIRNVLCHGSWRTPDKEGRSLPLFVNNKREIFQTTIDVVYLNQMQRHVAELICHVMSSVTFLGWQFAGSKGPGLPIWPHQV